MVLRPDVLAAALDSVADGRPMLALTPRGAPLTQARVRELAGGDGRHPPVRPLRGIRRADLRGSLPLEPVSIGDYVLSGGELGAMVILDACVRLLPGVMGAASSGEEESFETGLLEYPHYTRPVTWEGRTIPEVLRSGDHAKIAAWRHERAIEDTRLRRPDLIERHGGASQAPPSGARRRDTKAIEDMNLIETLEREAIDALTADKKIPEFRPGDTLRVGVKVIEGDRTRVQAFEGVCIARANKGVGSSFTVRKISFGEGVERVFPLYSPIIDSIEVVRRGDVRRAKLYYLRGRTGKAARIAERRNVQRDVPAGRAPRPRRPARRERAGSLMLQLAAVAETERSRYTKRHAFPCSWRLLAPLCPRRSLPRRRSPKEADDRADLRESADFRCRLRARSKLSPDGRYASCFARADTTASATTCGRWTRRPAQLAHAGRFDEGRRRRDQRSREDASRACARRRHQGHRRI